MTTQKHKVFLSSLKNGYNESLRDGVHWTGSLQTLRSTSKVCVKPNLTFPTFREGVMTNPEALEALVVLLKSCTDHITICESDSGGYNRFSMNEVFEATGIKEMAKRYGVRIVNLSYAPSRPINVLCGRRTISVPLPTMLLDETDLFITMPVPKIHMNTGVSLSLKNQWGIIQIPSLRLKLHPYFDEIIYAVNKALPKSVIVIDGKFGLTRSGPLKGDVIPLDWLLVSSNMFAADFVCCSLMGIDPFSVPHLKYALEKEGIADWSAIETNCDPCEFVAKEKFYLERRWTDYPGLLAFRSRPLAYLAYESPLAGVLHWLLYRFREPFYDYEATKRS